MAQFRTAKPAPTITTWGVRDGSVMARSRGCWEEKRPSAPSPRASPGAERDGKGAGGREVVMRLVQHRPAPPVARSPLCSAAINAALLRCGDKRRGRPEPGREPPGPAVFQVP